MTSKLFRVLLRVRMLYYIKHEIIGDYVQQIQDGMAIRYRIFFFLWSYWIFFCFLKIFFRHHQIIKISFSSFFPPQKINIFRQINKHINVRCIWEAVAGCKSHKFGVEAFVCVGRQLQIIFETKQTSYILQIFFFCFFCFLKTKSTKFFSQKSLSASCFFFIWLSCSVFAEVNWLHT